MRYEPLRRSQEGRPQPQLITHERAIREEHARTTEFLETMDRHLRPLPSSVCARTLRSWQRRRGAASRGPLADAWAWLRARVATHGSTTPLSIRITW